MQDDLGEKIRRRIVDGVDEHIADEASGGGAGRRRRRQALGSRLLFAVFLIAAGTLLFLGNIGILPIRNIWDYWPLVFVAIGIGKLFNSRTVGGRALSVLLIVFGALFLLLTLGIFQINAHDDSWPLSLLLIAFGVAALIKVLDSGGAKRPALGFHSQAVRSSSDNLLKDAAIFAEIRRKIETSDFQGGAANSIFGSVVLNLRRAQISSADKTATIDANAVFGSVKIRVPDNWRIDIQGAAVLGAYADKTIPPTAPDSETRTLIITGYAVFGSVEIEN